MAAVKLFILGGISRFKFNIRFCWHLKHYYACCFNRLCFLFRFFHFNFIRNRTGWKHFCFWEMRTETICKVSASKNVLSGVRRNILKNRNRLVMISQKDQSSVIKFSRIILSIPFCRCWSQLLKFNKFV